MVSLSRPPRVSATRGMKSVPVERQAERWWIVEAATAHGSSVKETARGEGEDGPL